MSDRPPTAPRVPAWCLLALLGILIFNVWWRGHTVGPTLKARYGLALWPVIRGESEPLDCDEAVYAYVGRRLLRGDVLYRDLTEPKPPGGYWLFTLAVALGGATEWTVRVTPIPFVLATISLLWWLGLRLRGPGAACLAAFTYAIVSTDPYLYGNGANLEHYLNACSVAGLACLVAGWRQPARWVAWAFGAGVCLGAACLFKQVLVVNLAVFALALLADRRRTRRARAGALAALAAGCGLVWGLAALALIVQGGGPSAFEEVFRYGAALARDTPAAPNSPPGWMRWVTGNAAPDGTLPWPFGTTTYLVWWGTGTWPLWIAALPAVGWIGLSRGRRATAERRLLAAWTVSACVQVALPGLYWAHYYLLPLPGICLAVAIALADAWADARTRPGTWRRIVSTMIAGGFALALGATAVREVRDYLFVAPEMLTVRDKGGGQWVALRALGRTLAARTRAWPETPRLFVWGWQSPLFIYSGFDGVSRHFFADPLMKAYAEGDHPLIVPRLERIMSDLRANPPEFVFVGDPPFPALRRFLAERYLPSNLTGPPIPDGRGLWVERHHQAAFESFGR